MAGVILRGWSTDERRLLWGAVEWAGLVFYESSFRTYVLFSTKYRKYALVLAFGGVSFKDVIIGNSTVHRF